MVISDISLLNIEGVLHIQGIYKNGVTFVRTYKNLVLDAMGVLLSDYLAGDENSRIVGMVFGDRGVTTYNTIIPSLDANVDKVRTTLLNEISFRGLLEKSDDGSFVNIKKGAGNKVEYSFTVDFNDMNYLSKDTLGDYKNTFICEMGLASTSNSTNNDIVCLKQFPIISKVPDLKLDFRWVLDFSIKR